MKKIYLATATVILWGSVFLVANAAAHPLGTNIVAPDGTVYTITTENGQTVRRPYTSAGAFLSYSFNSWSSTVAASVEDMALVVGTFIPPQEGKVFCSDRGGDKGTCYLITSGQKAGFTNEYVFYGFGYSFNNVLYGDVSFLNAASNISTSTMAHYPGTLVNKDGTVYLVGPIGLNGMPNSTTLQSWGYSFIDVVPANESDRSLPIMSVVTERKPGQLSSLNAIIPDLKFRILNSNISLPSDNNIASLSYDLSLWQTTNLVGAYVKKVSTEIWQTPDTQTKQIIHFEFTPEGTFVLADVTSKNTGRIFGIFFNNEIIGAPIIKDEINNGEFYFDPNLIVTWNNYLTNSLGDLVPSSATLMPPVPYQSPTLETDAKRLAGVRQIAAAQELYFNDHNSYPTNLSDLVPLYIGKLPIAPTPADGSCTAEQNSYKYILIQTNYYLLIFCLGGQTGGYSAGVNRLTPQGIDNINDQMQVPNNNPPSSGIMGQLKEPSLLQPDDHVLGNVNAKNTMVVYDDFQCPACKIFEPVLKQVPSQFTDTKVIFRHFPLTQIHKNAINAAVASEAASAQGKFWEFAFSLYDNQDSWMELSDPTDNFVELAKTVGIADINQFRSDIIFQKYINRVQRDLAESENLKLPGTPSVYFNGYKLPTAGQIDLLKEDATPYLLQ